MRHLRLIFLAAIVTLAWGACSKSAPTAAPAPTPPKAATSEAGKTAETPKGAQPAAVAAKVPAKADEADMVPEAEKKPQVTQAECDKACAHATKLSMASMPPDATPDMKAAIEKALQKSCPQDCLDKGTKALVECILGAKTGMELAADCQK